MINFKILLKLERSYKNRSIHRYLLFKKIQWSMKDLTSFQTNNKDKVNFLKDEFNHVISAFGQI